MKSTCLAILNYNGLHYLKDMLPTIRVACQNAPTPISVIILDNKSSKDNMEWVQKQFPEIKWISAPENDFLFSYNWLLEELEEDIVILLNNDLKVTSNFVAPLIRHFESPDVFSVCATSRDWDDTIFTYGPSQLKSHHGLYYWNFDTDNQEVCHTLFCSGGFMAVDRRKFVALGGFNRLFWPAYGEDVDLSYRAWRKGWRCIFEPLSVVFHHESGSWNSNGGNRSAKLCLRAQLLFQWASLPASAPKYELILALCVFAIRKLRYGQGWWLKVLIDTFLEWVRVRKQYHWMRTSQEELSIIIAKMSEPVRELRCTKEI